MTKVLFVCLGNICRSPLAEGILEQLLEEARIADAWEVESAGTAAYHIGEKADPRSREIAAQNGIQLSSLAQKVSQADFEYYDLIIAMDESNYSNLNRLCNSGLLKNKILMCSQFDEGNLFESDVPDPYYGGSDGFQLIFDQLMHCCKGILKKYRD